MYSASHCWEMGCLAPAEKAGFYPGPQRLAERGALSG